MKSGMMSFDNLFSYIRQYPEIPHKDEIEFVGFKDLYLNLVDSVPNLPGWYAWIRADGTIKKVIYIGQSQTRKIASLQARLKEEFLDEYVALWATIWDSDKVVGTLDQKYHGKYTASIKRSARKAGTTHIVWVGRTNLTDQELDVVEHLLIAKYNPPANRQTRNHTTSFPELFDEADKTLKSEIDRLV